MSVTAEQIADLAASNLLNAIYLRASQEPPESGTFEQRVISVRDDVLEQYFELCNVVAYRLAKQ